jgi:chorismate synthase
MSFRYLTAGESHGRGLVGIVEGLPSGLELTEAYIHSQLKRRKLGYGRGARQKIEDDSVEIVTGVRHEKTLGSPITLLLWNKDWTAWQDIMQAGPHAGGEVRRKVSVPRPGHADLVGGLKYDHQDMRNVLERSSARETAMRVALGTIARRFLEELGIHVGSRVVRIAGAVDPSKVDFDVSELNERSDKSQVRCLDPSAEAAMVKEVDRAKKEGNTLGGVIEVMASGVPLGLGSYSQWDRRLEAEIGRVFLSMNAIKGVEIGLGFGAAALPGTEVHDEYFPGKAKGSVTYKSNRSGGIDGGMSTGQPLVVRAAMKPLATLMKPLSSVDLSSGEGVKAHVERSDVCAVPAAAVIGESLLALVLAQAVLEKFGSDSMKELQPRVQSWKVATERE